MRDCHISYLAAGKHVNGDVVKLAVDREYDLKACNVDKEALRAWVKAYCKVNHRACKSEK